MRAAQSRAGASHRCAQRPRLGKATSPRAAATLGGLVGGSLVVPYRPSSMTKQVLSSQPACVACSPLVSCLVPLWCPATHGILVMWRNLSTHRCVVDGPQRRHRSHRSVVPPISSFAEHVCDSSCSEIVAHRVRRRQRGPVTVSRCYSDHRNPTSQRFDSGERMLVKTRWDGPRQRHEEASTGFEMPWCTAAQDRDHWQRMEAGVVYHT